MFRLADTLRALDLSGNRLQSLPHDLGRLHRLEVLFASGNRFEALPEALGGCASLEIVGFRASGVRHVPAASLPPRLRWLILTDNAIDALPEAIGRCARLQKLMLAGNRLAGLPPAIGALERLELLRLAANAFGTVEALLPPRLLELPSLAWLALGGNPCLVAAEQAARERLAVPEVDWAELTLGERLGEGASGVIHAVSWSGAPGRPLALKRFKGALTSDGLPSSELAACLHAGAHPNLVATVGRLRGHPEGADGLLLERISPDHRVLAEPPSFATCSRDVYPEGQRFTPEVAQRIVDGAAAAQRHLHGRGLVHGDLYAHNLLVGPDGHALLGDFGAACFVPASDPGRAEALCRIDARALQILTDEVQARVSTSA